MARILVQFACMLPCPVYPRRWHYHWGLAPQPFREVFAVGDLTDDAILRDHANGIPEGFTPIPADWELFNRDGGTMRRISASGWPVVYAPASADALPWAVTPSWLRPDGILVAIILSDPPTGRTLPNWRRYFDNASLRPCYDHDELVQLEPVVRRQECDALPPT